MIMTAGRGNATGIQWVWVRDAAKHPTVQQRIIARKMSVVLRLRNSPVKKEDESSTWSGFRQDLAPVTVVEIRGTWCFCKPRVLGGLNSHAPPPTRQPCLCTWKLQGW